MYVKYFEEIKRAIKKQRRILNPSEHLRQSFFVNIFNDLLFLQ